MRLQCFASDFKAIQTAWKKCKPSWQPRDSIYWQQTSTTHDLKPNLQLRAKQNMAKWQSRPLKLVRQSTIVRTPSVTSVPPVGWSLLNKMASEVHKGVMKGYEQYKQERSGGQRQQQQQTYSTGGGGGAPSLHTQNLYPQRAPTTPSSMPSQALMHAHGQQHVTSISPPATQQQQSYRHVRCYNCRTVLLVPTQYDVVKCGRCGTLLRRA